MFHALNLMEYFSLSDEDRDNADALVIKPPQAVIRSHRDKRSHKRTAKDRYKESVRKEKKHLYRYVCYYSLSKTLLMFVLFY